MQINDGNNVQIEKNVQNGGVQDLDGLVKVCENSHCPNNFVVIEDLDKINFCPYCRNLLSSVKKEKVVAKSHLKPGKNNSLELCDKKCNGCKKVYFGTSYRFCPCCGKSLVIAKKENLQAVQNFSGNQNGHKHPKHKNVNRKGVSIKRNQCSRRR